jgi:pilus assembly protein FimV
MLRKLALSLAVAGALSATQANALGLGEIQVKSALNEPLEAEIRLLQVRDLSPLQIQPRMADIDEFSLAGIDKSRFLTNVNFDVRVNPDGTGTIRMTSSAPIREPFLNFLVEVNWPSGRLVREYTLLLDPPVFDPTPTPTAIQPAQTRPAPQPQATAPVAASEPQLRRPAGAPPASNIRTRMDPQTEVYVDVRDTLWELAMEHRPDSSVSGEQMMLALQRKNPGSFPTGNINMLKAGTVMKLPTLDEINSLTKAQARAEVARQTQAWRSGRKTTAQPAPAPIQASEESSDAGKPAEPAPAAPAEPDSQLKIVTPEQGQGATDTTAGSDQASADTAPTDADGQGVAEEAAPAMPDEQTQALLERNEELENRLLLTQESVAKIERENTELTDKIDSIASQLDKLQRLIELKDRELAMMQQRLDQQAAEEAAGGPGLLDRLMQSPAYLAGIGGAALAVLLGLLLALRRKRNPAQEPTEAAEQSAAAKPAPQTDSDAIPDVAVAGAAGAAAAAVAVAADDDAEQPAAAPAPADTATDNLDDVADDELDDLDLDMDMDLDLDESAAPAEAELPPVEPIRDDEFDLGVDEELPPLSAEPEPQPEAPADEAVEEAEVDSALDDILGAQEPVEAAEEADAFDSGLDDLLAENADVDLAEESATEQSAPVESADNANETGDLDFAVDTFGQDDEGDNEVLDLPDDLEFDVSHPPAESPAEQSADEVEPQASDSEEDELAGLDFAVSEPAEEVAQKQENEDDDLLDDFFAEEEVDKKDEFAALPEVSDDDVRPITDEPIEVDTGENKVNLETVESNVAEEETFEIDPDLEAMLEATAGDEDEEAEAVTSAAQDDVDDLDALLASFEPEEEEPQQPARPKPGQLVEEELTANIAHDLEADLDSEIDDLLGSTDDEIALEEESAEESLDREDDSLESLNLLEGADEIETKLDLARAYIEMEDTDGAKDILNEIVSEGNPQQRNEAQRLLDTLD